MLKLPQCKRTTFYCGQNTVSSVYHGATTPGVLWDQKTVYLIEILPCGNFLLNYHFGITAW